MRPELVRRALVVALVCASALVPLRVARAGLGSLYTELVCREISDVLCRLRGCVARSLLSVAKQLEWDDTGAHA